MKVCDCVPGLEFDEERDLEQSPAWFLDGTHSIPPWTPMFGWFWVNFCRHGMQYGAEALQLPTTKGWDWRFKDGGGYLTILLVESEAERSQREQGFRKAIRPFLEDYEGLWNGLVAEMLARYELIKKVDGRAASNIELLRNFEYSIDTCRRMWEIHMYMMYGTYMPYVLFEQLCKQLLDIDDTHPAFLKLMSGFDNESFRVDKGLWEFARKAVRMGLKDIMLASPLKELVLRLEESDKGHEFMESFRLFLEHKAGWRMERMAEINVPTWAEEPSLALDRVRIYLRMGRDHDLDEERLKLERERHEAEKEVLQRILPEQRGWFSALMKIAQNSSRFSEEHNHYLDLYTHAAIRKTCMDLGVRFTAAKALDNPEDIFFLIPDEVRKDAIKTLGGTGNRVILPHLKTALNDDDPTVRMSVARILGTMKTDAAKKILIDESLKKDFVMKDFTEKKEFYEALVHWKDQEVKDFLHRKLREKKLWRRTKNNETRACAAYALGIIGDTDAVPYLQKTQGSKNTLLKTLSAAAIRQLTT